jgi:hypothetical protein
MMLHVFCQHSILMDLFFKFHSSGVDLLGEKLQTGSLVTSRLAQIFSNIGQVLNANTGLFANFLGQLFQPLGSYTISAKTMGSTPTFTCWDLIS